MTNQKIPTLPGTIILVIIAMTVFSFVWIYEKDQYQNEQISCPKNDDSLQIKKLQQQITDINTKNNRAIKEYNKTIDEVRREASDCRYVKTYHNLLNGFQISLPTSKWCSPSPYDKDPHLYDENGCDRNSQQACFGIEIQYGGNDSLITIDQMFKQISGEGRNPIMLPNLISNASVIKSKAPGPAEGWIYAYDIFFNGQYRLLIFSNNESFESVIKTLVLDK